MAAFGFFKPLTVQTGQFPSPQSGFPALLSFLVGDADFATTGNGGKATSSSGFDIRPYADANLATTLTFELVPGSYNAATGAFEMWVSLPTGQDGLTIYLAVGNSALTTDGSTTGVWPANWKGVYHYSNSAGTLTVNDSTSNANNGTKVNTPVVATGQVGQALSIGGTNYVTTAGSLGIASGTKLTAASWFKISNSDVELMCCDHPTTATFDLYVETTGHVQFSVYDNSAQYIRTSTLSGLNDSNWHRAVGVYNGGTPSLDIYIDGVLNNGTLNLTPPAALTSTASTLWLGAFDTGGMANGLLDEQYLIKDILVADWITAEYNNQKNLSSFWSVGPLTSAGIPNRIISFNHSLMRAGNF
jgi:hypothetical protein